MHDNMESESNQAEVNLKKSLETSSKALAYHLLNLACEELSVDVPELKSWDIDSIQEQATFLLEALKSTATTP